MGGEKASSLGRICLLLPLRQQLTSARLDPLTSSTLLSSKAHRSNDAGSPFSPELPNLAPADPTAQSTSFRCAPPSSFPTGSTQLSASSNSAIDNLTHSRLLRQPAATRQRTRRSCVRARVDRGRQRGTDQVEVVDQGPSKYVQCVLRFLVDGFARLGDVAEDGHRAVERSMSRRAEGRGP